MLSHELAQRLLLLENRPIDFRCNNSNIEVMLDCIYPNLLRNDIGEIIDPPIECIVFEINQLR